MDLFAPNSNTSEHISQTARPIYRPQIVAPNFGHQSLVEIFICTKLKYIFQVSLGHRLLHQTLVTKVWWKYLLELFAPNSNTFPRFSRPQIVKQDFGESMQWNLLHQTQIQVGTFSKIWQTKDCHTRLWWVYSLDLFAPNSSDHIP